VDVDVALLKTAVRRGMDVRVRCGVRGVVLPELCCGGGETSSVSVGLTDR